MTTIEPEHYPQDDLSGTLNVPAGAEHVAPMPRPADDAVPANVMPAAMPMTAPPPERASLTVKIIVAGVLAVCATLGAVLLMRGA